MYSPQFGVVNLSVRGIDEIAGDEHSSGVISDVPRSVRIRTHVSRAVSHRFRVALGIPRTQ